MDEFEKSKIITTESWLKFASSNRAVGLKGNLRKVDDLYVFYFQFGKGLGCFSEYTSNMKIMLSNDEVVELSQITDTDCGESPYAGFVPITKEEQKSSDYEKIMEENIEKLLNNDWVTIRITGSEYYTDVKPNTTKRNPLPEHFFRQHISATLNK